ncbi:glycosyltransferase family protein [Ghiorsea bivora]|uniref:glycosyltransferase family protein n=1 Tax=Ghiorsea bivora TaxID=1485545 RepID=UPI000571C3EE|nr:glycosyltransferase [Ghiorsea bivora]
MIEQVSKPLSIIAFIHTYQADGEFDPYMVSVVKGFESIGLNVHVIRTNDLVPSLASTHIGVGVNINKLVDFINYLNPLFIFTTNRGGITQEIMSQTECPIITRMVDLVPFYHQGGLGYPLFCDRDYVFVPTLESVKSFEQQHPILKGKVSYLPFATDPSAFVRYCGVEKDISVSFVGTYFYADLITNILSDLKNAPRLRSTFLKLSDDIKNNFHINFEKLSYSHDIEVLCKELGVDSEFLRMQISNVHALNKRVHYLDAVVDMGLKLFGTSNWVQVSQFSMRLLQSFQFDEFIDSRDKLIKLYQRSRIALNIPHHQAGAGMPYRVYDIMASSALLITEYHKDSELFVLFGQDMPVPMYKNATELRELVAYFLEHESERRAIVEQCNQLIKDKGITFEHRAKSYCDEAGVRLDSSLSGSVSYLQFRGGRWVSSSDITGEAEKITRAMLIEARLYSSSQWFLPYNVIKMWEPRVKVLSVEGDNKAESKMTFIKARAIVYKLKAFAKWVVPFRLFQVLEALLRRS